MVFSTLPSYNYHPSPTISHTNLSHPLLLFYNDVFPSLESMCNPDYIFQTAPEVLAGGLHHKENVLGGGQLYKTRFYTFFDYH